MVPITLLVETNLHSSTAQNRVHLGGTPTGGSASPNPTPVPIYGCSEVCEHTWEKVLLFAFSPSKCQTGSNRAPPARKGHGYCHLRLTANYRAPSTYLVCCCPKAPTLGPLSEGSDLGRKTCPDPQGLPSGRGSGRRREESAKRGAGMPQRTAGPARLPSKVRVAPSLFQDDQRATQHKSVSCHTSS